MERTMKMFQTIFILPEWLTQISLYGFRYICEVYTFEVNISWAVGSLLVTALPCPNQNFDSQYMQNVKSVLGANGCDRLSIKKITLKHTHLLNN